MVHPWIHSSGKKLQGLVVCWMEQIMCNMSEATAPTTVRAAADSVTSPGSPFV